MAAMLQSMERGALMPNEENISRKSLNFELVPDFFEMIFSLFERVAGLQPFQTLTTLLLCMVWFTGALHVLSNIFLLKADANGDVRLENTVQGAFRSRSNGQLTSAELAWSNSLLFVGWLFGASLWSILADRFGRRPVCLVCFIALMLADLAVFGSPTYPIYLAARILLGFSVGGIGVISYVWGCEFMAFDVQGALRKLSPEAAVNTPIPVAATSSTRGGALFNISWSVGGMVLPLVAWLIPYWRHFYLFLVAFNLTLGLLLMWLMPESPKWLMSQKKWSQARQLVTRMQRFNIGRYAHAYESVPGHREDDDVDHGDDHMSLRDGSSQSSHGLVIEDEGIGADPLTIDVDVGAITKRNEFQSDYDTDSPESPQPSAQSNPNVRRRSSRWAFLRLMRPPLALTTICLAVVWFTNAFVYYGLNLNTSAIPGNIYLITFLMNVLAIPGQVLSIPAAHRWSCRRCLLLLMPVVGVIFCTMTALSWLTGQFIPGGIDGNRSWLNPLLMVISFAGQFVITMTFTLCYAITADAYPTVIRGAGVGLGVMMGRVGAMVSPFVVNLQSESGDASLVYFIFGAVGLASGVAMFLLPRLSKDEDDRS